MAKVFLNGKDLWVAAGELISVFVLGLPLNALIGKLGILKEEK